MWEKGWVRGKETCVRISELLELKEIELPQLRATPPFYEGASKKEKGLERV